MKKNRKKKIISQKISNIFLYVVGSLIILLLLGGFFLFPKQAENKASMYIFPENPKQGDTVFIRVRGNAKEVSGNFENEKLVFYKKGNSLDWISFLGIDADQKPGVYKINIKVSEKEQLSKEIKIFMAGFSEQVSAPQNNKNKISNQQAVDNIVKNDNPVIKNVLSNITVEPYFKNPFSFPLVAMRAKGFSFGQFIGFGNYSLQHLGVDLRAPSKTKVYAVNDGKVVAILNLPNYGKTVIIDHGLDIFSMYLHLDQFKVEYGQIVKQDQVIGLSGETGYATAPHLHFSMRVNGTRVNPISFIETTKKINESSAPASISDAFLNIFN